MMLMSAEKMKKMRRILLLLITRTLSEVVHFLTCNTESNRMLAAVLC
jgi:hypothetical protein